MADVIQKGLAYVFMKHKWLKLNYIPVLNVHLFTDSLGLHKFCIL